MKPVFRFLALWVVALLIGVSTLAEQSVWTAFASQYGSGGIAPDPGDPTAIYLMTSQGVVRYNQSTQTSVVLPGSPVLRGLAVSPSNPEILYGVNEGLFKSPDGGQIWSDISSNFPSYLTPPLIPFQIVVDPNDPNVLYAIIGSPGSAADGLFHGLFRSADGGETWALINPLDGIQQVTPQLAISVGNPATLFLLETLCCSPPSYSYNKLVRTSDGGATWTEATVPFSSQSFTLAYGFVTDPRSPLTLYLFGLNSVVRSVDLGSTWTSIGLNGVPFGYFVNALAVDPNTPSTLLAMEYSSGVHRTTDGGGHWAAFNSGSCPDNPCFNGSSLAFTNADPSVAFLSGVGPVSGLFRTGLPSAGSCVVGYNVLCSGYGRFSVSVEWIDSFGVARSGNAVVITPNSSGFWFFTPDNVDLVVKVLDGRDVNGHFWVFYGSLTDVQFTLTVTDTQTGAVKTYFNSHGQLASVADTAAF
jgi:hypothetical protein